MGKSILLQYLKRQIKTILLICVFFGMIFGVTLYVYDLPIEPVGYAFVLTCVVGLCFALASYVRYRRQHIELTQMLDNITVDMSHMPEPYDLIESDYCALIQKVYDAKFMQSAAFDASRTEMLDYYTLWVHQIKTPISAMRLLLKDDCGEMSNELLKIEQYTEMVLQYLRLDSDYTDFVLRRYDLDEIVKQSVHRFARMLIAKRIKLDYTPLNHMVITDEKWMVFVVDQIISNAIKYIGKPGGSITINVDGDCLVIRDTGIGIRKEDLPRVFQKGFTGYNGRMDKQSTGIGLYLCKRTLDKLCCDFTIDSEIGVGTAVAIRFNAIQRQVT